MDGSIFYSISSQSRCSLKHPTTLTSLSNICSPAGTFLHVNNSYLGCQPYLTKEPLHLPQRDGHRHVIYCQSHLTIPTKITPLTGPTTAGTGRNKGAAEEGERQQGCIIHLFITPSLFSSHHSKSRKKKTACPLFFCFCKCQLSKRD